MRIYFLIFFCASIFIQSNAQIGNCAPPKSIYSELYSVTPDDVRCIAQNADKDISLFYTFAAWCSPCRAHLPELIELSKKHEINFYVIITARENNVSDINKTVGFLDGLSNDIDKFIISDSLYIGENKIKKPKLIDMNGKREREKYDNFLKALTPDKFEHISDMGKSVLVNKEGNTILVTNYKDKDGRKDNSKVNEKIIKYIQSERSVQSVVVDISPTVASL
jgi:thiol-disulfide isomerase/thioredoxin